jgi:hypothetical protein
MSLRDLDTLATSIPAGRDKPCFLMPSIAIMKAHLNKLLALAVLAATLPAQSPTEGNEYAARLQRAQLLEQQEGDLTSAQSAYTALLDDSKAPQSVHESAYWHLAALEWRLGKRDDARVMLTNVINAGGEFAEAAQALLKSESAEAQGKQERVQRARAIIKRYAELTAQQPAVTPETMNLDSELRQLGKAAAQAIVEELNVSPTLRNDGRVLNGADQPVLAWLARQLWVIGTEPAQRFLADAAEQGPLPWQRFLIQNTPNQLPPDLGPAVLLFTQTNDPTRETWRSATACLTRLPITVITDCLQSNVPATREAGLVALTSLLERNRPDVLTSYVPEQRAVIASALDYSTESLRDASWDLLTMSLQSGPKEATDLFLAEVARRPNDTPTIQRITIQVRADDAWLHRVTETARVLGAIQKYEQRPLHVAVWQLVKRHVPQWTTAALPDVEALIELGYAKDCSHNDGVNWLHHYVQLSSTAQRASLLRHAPEMADVGSFALDLLRRDPSPDYLPAIAEVLAQCNEAADIAWYQAPSNESMRYLLWLAAASKHPDAGRVIGEFAVQHPQHIEGSIRVLVPLSQERSDAAAQAALRQLMVMDPKGVRQLTPQLRNEMFAELCHAGDPLAIPLFVRAYELGLEPSRMSFEQLDPKANMRLEDGPGQAVGIAFLMITKRSGSNRNWSDYDPEELATAWRTIFASEQADDAWRDLSKANGRVPTAALGVFGQQLLARWAATPDKERGRISNQFWSFREVTPATLAASNELRETIAALLSHQDDQLAAAIFNALHADTAQTFASIGLQQLRDGKSKAWLKALIAKDIALGTEDWLAALAGDNNTRLEAIRGLNKNVPAEVLTAVTALLQDTNQFIRIETSKTLARIVGPDAVASLLPLLQDESEEVRKAVRELLTQMREEQEQRTFWARVGDVELTPQSAAAKLIGQAMPDQDKAQRLLAIQSLALLNTPESLPYLIDWSKDKDADVQAAAKQAIAAIHQKGAATPTPDKK